jgi:hypothetical protein
VDAINLIKLGRAKIIALYKIEYHHRSITISFFPQNSTLAGGIIMQGRTQKTTI